MSAGPARGMIAAASLFGGGSIVLLVAMPLGSYLHFGWPLEKALIWDGALSLVFFVQHSVMVRLFFRKRLRIPEHYWGSIYATSSGVVLAMVVLLWQSSGGALFDIPMAVHVVLGALSLLGAGIFVWGFLLLRGIDPLGISALRAHLRDAKPKPAPFVVSGPYRLVRHPLYLAALLLIWCAGDVTADRILFCVLWTIWIVVATRWEEADLVSEIGEPYRQYQKQVPMLIPWRGKRPLNKGKETSCV